MKGRPHPGHEYAYVLRGKAGEWRKAAAADDESGSAQLMRGEERLSMFPAFYAQDDGHRRRLFVGSVPVGRREAYQGAAADSGRPPPWGSRRPRQGLAAWARSTPVRRRSTRRCWGRGRRWSIAPWATGCRVRTRTMRST